MIYILRERKNEWTVIYHGALFDVSWAPSDGTLAWADFFSSAREKEKKKETDRTHFVSDTMQVFHLPA